MENGEPFFNLFYLESFMSYVGFSKLMLRYGWRPLALWHIQRCL